MIEIGTEVELFHPRDLVWRALTDQTLLAKWFAEAAPAPERLVLRTAELPGFDADLELEVLELRAPERLALACREGKRRSRVTTTLVPTAHGCRMSVHEALEQGDWDAARRDRREEHHQQAVGVRLPAILDWLAFQQVDLRRAEGDLTAELPIVRTPTRSGRRRAMLIGALTTVLLAGGVTAWAARPEPTAARPLPESSPLVLPSARNSTPPATPSRTAPAASRSIGRPSPTPSLSATRTASPTRPPAAALTARYETVSDRVFGYRGQVVVSNPGSAEKPGWTVTVTLASGATVSSVNGADWEQDGSVVTFTGAPLPAGQSATVRFDVRDPDLRAKTPDGCTVDGNPCTGL
ncbi:SRPBCC domain-containing protein [Micromonospora soli]|uniref:SRPBCC domain-containing protein n=1 Tax=Micromonospora sp. NBRC 110009 TaxID=3061627 RepID=UPI002671DCE6|nr:SRPBCC domain-containing protein [Micromonospora sp. NBRC 110009]WKT97338.1 SRPBCC domain-containing protein [Micromonospora sp. NBRC 110009]